MYFLYADFSGMECHSLSQSDSLLPAINHQHQPMTGFVSSAIYLTPCITSLNFLISFHLSFAKITDKTLLHNE